MTEDRKRAPRQEQEATQRRRRNDGNIDRVAEAKLYIPDEAQDWLKKEGRTPRWVNDEKGRIQRLTTKDDYDRVPDVAPVQVGTNPDGSPLFAHLLAKKTEFIREDQVAADRRRTSTEKAMLQGKVPNKAGEEATPVQGQMGAEVYADKANAIGRENRIIE